MRSVGRSVGLRVSAAVITAKLHLRAVPASAVAGPVVATTNALDGDADLGSVIHAAISGVPACRAGSRHGEHGRG